MSPNRSRQTLRTDLSRPFLPQLNHSGDVRTQMYQVTITQEQGRLRGYRAYRGYSLRALSLAALVVLPRPTKNDTVAGKVVLGTGYG